MCSPKKVNLNNAWITHQQNTQETFIEESSSGEEVDLQPATSLKTNYPRDISHRACQNLKNTAFNRSSFVDTSNRDIILKQKLVNLTVGWENKN